MAKHCVWMYLLGLPGFERVWHPDPPSRFGKAKSSWLRVLAGSEPVPQVAVKGTPSLAVKIRPSSQPSGTHFAGPVQDFTPGTSPLAFRTRVRPTLKSESPRVNRRSQI